MELKPYLENLKDSLLRAYDLLVARGFITDEVLRRYSELNLHSILQHCLIVSADKSGLVALPEYKIALGVPIDKYAIDDRYRGRRARYVRRIRVRRLLPRQEAGRRRRGLHARRDSRVRALQGAQEPPVADALPQAAPLS